MDFKVPPGAGNRKGSAVLDAAPKSKQTVSEGSAVEPENVVESSSQEAAEAVASTPIDYDTICPMCSWNVKNRDVVQIGEDDKNAFISAVLGSKRFKKTYERLGGRIKVTMRSRTVQETDEVMKQLEKERTDKDMTSVTEFMVRTWHYQMIVGLEKVEIEGQTPIEFPEVFDGNSSLEAAADRVIKGWPEIIYTIIQNVSRHFDQVVQALTLRAHDSDFWKAADTDT